MISVIGKTHTVIGFGLCGLDDVHEVQSEIDQETIYEIMAQVSHSIIMIDQELMHKVKKLPQDKVVIPIPTTYEKDDIDALITDTLGIEIEE